MDGLKIAAAVIRTELVCDLSKPPEGMSVSRRRPACVSAQSREFAKGVTQLPAEFSGSRSLRPFERGDEKITVFPVINPACHDDLCSNEGAAKIDNQSVSPFGLENKTQHLPQAESRVLLSEKDILHFDLNPR